MNYSSIKTFDIADGPGVRTSLFVSGCTHHCKNCFQPETWDFEYGKPFTEETIKELVNDMKPDYVTGFTLLGGDPMEIKNQRALLPLLQDLRMNYPEKTIWCYTGYTFETDILEKMCSQHSETEAFLSFIDVLVDGEFIEEKKDISLLFRGSSNQRLIDIPKSMKAKETILWNN